MKNLSLAILFLACLNCLGPKNSVNNLKNTSQEENQSPKKEDFISFKSTDKLGAVSTVRTLNNLDYSKYEVDLLLTEEPKSKFLFAQIPTEVNIIRLDRFSSFEEFAKDRSYDLEVSSRSVSFNEMFINSELSKKK